MGAHCIMDMDRDHSLALTHVEEIIVKGEEDLLYIAYANTYTRIDISSESGADLRRGNRKNKPQRRSLTLRQLGFINFSP